MRAVAVILAAGLLIGGNASWAQSDQDSYCLRAPLRHQSDPAPWIVDDDINERLNFGLTNLVLNNSDIENAVDAALQDMARSTRLGSRARVLPSNGGASECNADDTDTRPCVAAYTNQEAPDTCNNGCIAWGGCDANGCFVDLCQACNFNGDWQDGDFHIILAHELSHAYGLAHTDSGGAACSGGAPFGCGTSDGCSSELMCTALGCMQSQFHAEGDQRGLRASVTTASEYSRKVFFGRDNLSDGLQNPSRTELASHAAAYHPRIACASSSTPTNQCAAVFATRTSTLSSVKVLRLNTPAGTSDWTTKTVVQTLGVTSIMPPDVAVNATGTVAYIVYVNTNHEPVFVRVPLNGDPTTTLSLGSVDAVAIDAVLPPRIEFADGMPRVLVYDAVSNGTPNSFLPPMLRLISVVEAGTSANLINLVPATNGVDIDNNAAWAGTHAFASDFDFACYETGGVTTNVGRCTIVAHFYHDDSNLLFPRARSIGFDIDGTTAQILNTNWDVSNAANINGIIGVDMNGGLASDLFVSTSVPVVDATTTTNTRVSRVDGNLFGGTVESATSHRGDAQACATSQWSDPDQTANFGAAAMHGGYSIAFCPSCATGGTLESIGWGIRADGNTNCY